MEQGKIDDALRICNDILQKEPAQIDALMLKSDLLNKKNDIAGSINTLEKAYWLALSMQSLHTILHLSMQKMKIRRPLL